MFSIGGLPPHPPRLLSPPLLLPLLALHLFRLRHFLLRMPLLVANHHHRLFKVRLLACTFAAAAARPASIGGCESQNRPRQ
jgi:hypothetical protein